jgi:Spy/CpxP family protein refolding chaperone
MRKRVLILLGAALLMMTIHPLLAQENPPGNRQRMMANRRNMMGIPDLTGEQQAQIKAVKLELEKAVIPLKGDVKVLDAEFKKLLASGGASERDIDVKIDEISALRVKMQKLQVKHHLAIRSLLTEAQRIAFDRRILAGPRRRILGRRATGRRLLQRRRIPAGAEDVDKPGESF